MSDHQRSLRPPSGPRPSSSPSAEDLSYEAGHREGVSSAAMLSGTGILDQISLWTSQEAKLSSLLPTLRPQDKALRAQLRLRLEQCAGRIDGLTHALLVLQSSEVAAGAPEKSVASPSRVAPPPRRSRLAAIDLKADWSLLAGLVTLSAILLGSLSMMVDLIASS